MPQNPQAAYVAKNSDNVLVPLLVDDDGALVVAGAESGEAVTIADGADETQGAKADAAVSTGAAASVVALLKGLQVPLNYGYETVAASQTDQVLGGAGATGDLLQSITYIPATTAAGAVSIKDGSGSAITLFVGGGTTPLVDLRPVTIPLNIRSAAGAWKVTTGANVSVIASGKFTA